LVRDRIKGDGTGNSAKGAKNIPICARCHRAGVASNCQTRQFALAATAAQSQVSKRSTTGYGTPVPLSGRLSSCVSSHPPSSRMRTQGLIRWLLDLFGSIIEGRRGCVRGHRDGGCPPGVPPGVAPDGSIDRALSNKVRVLSTHDFMESCGSQRTATVASPCRRKNAAPPPRRRTPRP
jgi:hypothetical protein